MSDFSLLGIYTNMNFHKLKKLIPRYKFRVAS